MAAVGNNDIFPDKWWVWAIGTVILYYVIRFILTIC